MRTHQPLEGIEVGDVGPKIALPFNDNGYMIFKRVRVPKDALLSRYVKIKPSGEFEYGSKEAIRLMYGGMLNLRVIIVKSGFYYIGRPLTIAVRYSFLRKQFEDSSGKEEQTVMGYQMQQYKLMPAISTTFAIMFVGISLQHMYGEFQDEL